MLALHIGIIGVLSLVMGATAQVVVKYVRRVARRVGLSEFVVAFVVLGLATSAPEISVAVFSALRGTPELSLGNLLGANIVVLSLLCGLAAILAGRIAPRTFYRFHTLPLFLADVALPVLLLSDGALTRMDGVILVLAHVGFMAHLYQHQKPDPDDEAHRRGPLWRNVFIAGAAVCGLLVSAYFMVGSAVAIAEALHVHPFVVGMVIFSVGTNLPELSFVLTQSRRNKEVVIGDLFGSVLVNAPTLGLLALISPFAIQDWNETVALSAFLLALLVIFGAFMWSKRSLTRREGFALVAFYVVYLAYASRLL